MSELGLRGCHLKSSTQLTFEVSVQNDREFIKKIGFEPSLSPQIRKILAVPFQSKESIVDRGVFDIRTTKTKLLEKIKDVVNIVEMQNIQIKKNCQEVCIPPFTAFVHFKDHITYRHVDMGHNFAWLLPAKVKMAKIWLFWERIKSYKCKYSSYTCNERELESYFQIEYKPKVFIQMPGTAISFKPLIPHAVVTVFEKKGAAILVGPHFAYFNDCEHIERYIKMGSGFARGSKAAYEAVEYFIEYFLIYGRQHGNIKVIYASKMREDWKSLRTRFNIKAK
ncbi:hypothetical protein ROZALSC1DRAFT_24753 [Rozella allomycis CSF55]|uniref:Uncharacterized protein n=1 Tax=Rozella allomycis (strain CSF55) TaxID=988480 RepID=A0A4V1IZ58_ROZAC|nr:hypothetical protein ROZALSC1DRAFT_24753 [Rozella allomycis CSF55]